jgi:hypothetical protein
MPSRERSNALIVSAGPGEGVISMNLGSAAKPAAIVPIRIVASSRRTGVNSTSHERERVVVAPLATARWRSRLECAS